jgi:hypothetical protein
MKGRIKMNAKMKLYAKTNVDATLLRLNPNGDFIKPDIWYEVVAEFSHWFASGCRPVVLLKVHDNKTRKVKVDFCELVYVFEK